MDEQIQGRTDKWLHLFVSNKPAIFLYEGNKETTCSSEGNRQTIRSQEITRSAEEIKDQTEKGVFLFLTLSLYQSFSSSQHVNKTIVTIEKVNTKKTPLYNVKANETALSFLFDQHNAVKRMNVFSLKAWPSFSSQKNIICTYVTGIW